MMWKERTGVQGSPAGTDRRKQTTQRNGTATRR
jgi:hypothetical protein